MKRILYNSHWILVIFLGFYFEYYKDHKLWFTLCLIAGISNIIGYIQGSNIKY